MSALIPCDHPSIAPHTITTTSRASGAWQCRVSAGIVAYGLESSRDGSKSRSLAHMDEWTNEEENEEREGQSKI